MLQHMIHVGRVAAADGGVGRRAWGCNSPAVLYSLQRGIGCNSG